MKWLIAAVLIAALAGGGLWYWKHQGDKGPDYKTAPATMGDLIQVVTATGQLNPQTNVNVGSQVSGIISKIYVDFNSPVTNNQLVAQIDPATYKAIVAQAQADSQRGGQPGIGAGGGGTGPTRFIKARLPPNLTRIPPWRYCIRLARQ